MIVFEIEKVLLDSLLLVVPLTFKVNDVVF